MSIRLAQKAAKYFVLQTKMSFMLSDNTKLLWGLQKIRSSLKNVVYEAVPAGYSLVRLLRSAGLPAEVVAAGKTPRMTDYSLFPGHAATDVTELHNEVEQKGKGAFERKLSALITDTRSVLE